MKKFLPILLVTAFLYSCENDLGCKNSLTDPCFDWAYCNANMYDNGATQELIDWCVERYNLPPAKELVDDTTKTDTTKADTTVIDTLPSDTLAIDTISADTTTKDSIGE